jgi:hypothetical protein
LFYDQLSNVNHATMETKCDPKLKHSYTFTILACIFPLLMGATYQQEIQILANESIQCIDATNDFMSMRIKIKIGNQTFTATLLDNASASAFKSMLPVTVTMTELNNNEKYYRFSENLPTNASNPRTINSGDLMLWGSDTLVIFYKTFSTSYSYTKLGKVDDPTGLATALGSGNVSVTFELE